MHQRPNEFWQQDVADTRQQLRKLAWRMGLLFVALLVILSLFLWRTTAAVEFASARMQGTAQAKYRVWGHVTDAKTGKPIPWPVLADQTDLPGPYFHSTGKPDGSFEHFTLSTPHSVRVTAYGYKPASIKIGRAWWLWTPSGEEQSNVTLQPDR